MMAKVRTTKVMINGTVRGRVITGFENVKSMEELPEKYTIGIPSFWLIKEVFTGIVLHAPESPSRLIYLGNTITDKELCDIITWMRRAGARLTKINKREKEKKEQETWKGEEIIEI